MRKIFTAMILSIFLLIISSCNSVYAGTGAIPSGENIKLLKDNLRFKSTDTKIMSNDADDPAVVGKDAEIGSLYIKKTTGELFQKMDSGSSTNWNTILGGASGNGTDNHATRWDGTGAPTLQDSLVIIDDVGAVSGVTQIDVDNIQIDANTILSTDVNGNIILNPNGTGGIELPDLTASRPLKLNATSTIVSGFIDLQVDISNILPIANGGTATSTALNNDRIMVSSGGAIHEAPALTDGQLLIGGTGSGAAPNSITGTVNQVTVTNGPNSITLSTPQDINSTSTPTFSSLTLSGLTEDSILFAGPGGLVSEDNLNFYFDNPTDSFYLSGTSTVTGMSIVDNITLDGNTISSVGDLTIDPSGAIILPDLLVSKPLKLSATSSIISGDIDLSSEVTGILPIANGGTGTTTPAVIFDGDGVNVTAKRDSFKFDNGSVFNAPDDETVSFSHLQGEGSDIFNTSPYKMFGKKGFAKYGETTDFTTGRSATFDGGGAINGTFGKTQTDLLETSDTDNYIYIQFAGSLNDYFYLTIPVDEGKNIGFRFLYNYDGDDSDLEYEAKCSTSGDILTDNITTTLPAAASSTPVAGSLYIPTGCGDLKFGFSNSVENIGQIFRFNRLSFTDNPYVDKSFQDENTFGAVIENPSGTASIANQSTDEKGTNFIASVTRTPSAGVVEVVFTTGFFSVAPSVITVSGSGNAGADYISVDATITGFTAIFENHAGTRVDTDFTIIAHRVGSDYKLPKDHVIAYNSKNAANSMVRMHTANGYASTDTKIRRMSQIELDDSGTFAAISVTQETNYFTIDDSAANGTVITIKDTGVYSISYTENLSSGNAFGISKNSTQLTTDILSINADDRLIEEWVHAGTASGAAPWIGMLKKNAKIRMHTQGTSASTNARVNFTITRIGVGDLLGVPKPLVGIIKNEQTSGTQGGTCTSGSWVAKTLNTTYQDFSKFGTLSANQLVLDAGTYCYSLKGLAQRSSSNRVRLYDNDGSAVVSGSLGMSVYATPSTGSTIEVTSKGCFSITSKTSYQMEQRCGSTQATTGYGNASSLGTEVYDEVKITKYY